MQYYYNSIYAIWYDWNNRKWRNSKRLINPEQGSVARPTGSGVMWQWWLTEDTLNGAGTLWVGRVHQHVIKVYYNYLYALIIGLPLVPTRRLQWQYHCQQWFWSDICYDAHVVTDDVWPYTCASSSVGGLHMGESWPEVVRMVCQPTRPAGDVTGMVIVSSCCGFLFTCLCLNFY